MGALRDEGARLELGLESEVLAQLQCYDGLLVRWNRKINLTRLRQPGERARWMYGESLWGARLIRPQGELLDLGSGSGFPGLAFKLLNPSLQLVLVESRMRKAHFLQEVCRILELDGVEVCCERIEDCVGRRQRLLHVCWRAVTLGAETLQEVAAKLLPDGSLISFAGSASADLPLLERIPGLVLGRKERFPGSEERYLMQYARCST